MTKPTSTYIRYIFIIALFQISIIFGSDTQRQIPLPILKFAYIQQQEDQEFETLNNNMNSTSADPHTHYHLTNRIDRGLHVHWAKRENRWEEAEDAVWQIVTSAATHLLTNIAVDAYNAWKKPSEIKSAEAIQIHELLEEQLQSIRIVLIKFYSFIQQNIPDELVKEKFNNAVKAALTNIICKHNLSHILTKIKIINAIKAQYEFVDDPACKEELLQKFLQEFNQLLRIINCR